MVVAGEGDCVAKEGLASVGAKEPGDEEEIPLDCVDKFVF